MAIHLSLPLLALLSIGSVPIAADEVSPSPALSRTSGADGRFLCGLKADSLLGAAFSLAWMRGDESGWFAQASPGIGGGKVSVGYGLAVLNYLHGGTPVPEWMHLPWLGYSAKATYLKTWWPKTNGTPSESLVGIEVGVTILLTATVGVFRAIPDGHGHGDYKFTVGGGVGF